MWPFFPVRLGRCPVFSQRVQVVHWSVPVAEVLLPCIGILSWSPQPQNTRVLIENMSEDKQQSKRGQQRWCWPGLAPQKYFAQGDRPAHSAGEGDQLVLGKKIRQASQASPQGWCAWLRPGPMC